MRAAEKHRLPLAGGDRRMPEAIPDAMVVVNARGEIVLLNLRAEKQFGYCPDELLGQLVSNILPGEFTERLFARGLRSAQEGQADPVGAAAELAGRRKDGSEFPIELTLSSLKSAEGAFVTAAIRDAPARPMAARPSRKPARSRVMEEALFPEQAARWPIRDRRAVERLPMRESLRRALSHQEFEVHYQPKVDLKTGAITGAEALIRWMHPLRGSVPPAQFIPVAEECGLILPIGKWVLREACTQARAWVDAGLPPATMAVNISAMEFRHESFMEGVLAILNETRLDPGSLELELTESVLMTRVGSTLSSLHALREKGLRLAVDDFGTGYSSLSYLRTFPIDALKIDQSFVREITTAPDETMILATMIHLGRDLKLRVVAEGVETDEELAFLQSHRCDEAQGFRFSRPVPPGEFATLLRNGIPPALCLETGRLATQQDL